jgi:hypothetical protein
MEIQNLLLQRPDIQHRVSIQSRQQFMGYLTEATPSYKDSFAMDLYI